MAAGAQVGATDPPAGVPAADLARSGFDITALLVAVAQALRDLHAIRPPIAVDEALDAGPEVLVDRARARVRAAFVDQAGFDPPYQRYSPAELLDLVDQGRPAALGADGLTLVHGGARLDRVWLDDGRVTGWSHLDHAGVGDPYRDLATVAIDLAAQVTPEALGPFIDAYGLDHADVLRLDWHVMVDQLLR